jgi:uncharacterized protein (TIGR02757 family)
LLPAVQRHHSVGFIATDPMQFPHARREEPLHCEVLCFLVACLSYGQRPLIIQRLQELIVERFDNNLLACLTSDTEAQLKKRVQGWYYRFQTSADVLWLLRRLSEALEHYGSLASLFQESLQKEATLRQGLSRAVDTLIAQPVDSLTYGQRYLLPNPREGSACKRLWLALRWLCRSDAALVQSGDLAAPVDFGHWAGVISASELLLPVDTHVFKQGKRWGVALRNTPDWLCAEQMTHRLGPVFGADVGRCDFAFMGLGTVAAHADSV